MKKVFGYVIDFVRNDLNGWYLLSVALFLIPAIAFNYLYDFESSVFTPLRKEWYYCFLCLLYYGIPYWYALAAYILIYKKKELLWNRSFMALALLFPAILAFDEAFNLHKQLVAVIPDEIHRYYVKSTLNHGIGFITLFMPVLLYYLLVEKEDHTLYGLKPGQWQLKPYLIMLFGIMTPLIILASFSESFQQAYPIYNLTKYKDQLPGSYWQQVLVYESVYGLDFVYVEWFFRGIMIHAMAKHMGTECVLAMATVYCTYHFGKPMGESVSSFFGGTILGVLSLRTHSVYGGIIIHMGIAWMMELASFAQLGF